MDDRGLQGWAHDPFGLHEARYFSGGHPTKLVRDGTVESYDEPPSDTYYPADTMPEQARLGRGTAPAPSNFPGAPLCAAAPPYAGAPPRAAAPPHAGAPPYAGAAPQRAGVASRYAAGLDLAVGPPPRRSRAGLFAAATAVVAIAVIAGVILVNDSKPPTTPNQAPTMSPAAFVTQSAHRTLAEHTVDITLSGTIQVLGKSIGVYGTGEADLSTNAMTFDAGLSTSTGVLEEKEILVNGNLYFTVSVNGKSLASLTGGRSWIQLPVQQSASANLAGSDPASALSALEQSGATVRTLGTAMVGGVSCTGYAATISTQAMIAGARQEDAQLGVSSAVTDQEVQLLQGMSPTTVTLWIDAQGLVRQMSINLQMDVLGTTESADLVMGFSHYGAPVTITAPAPSDTTSFTSFLQNLGHSGAS